MADTIEDKDTKQENLTDNSISIAILLENSGNIMRAFFASLPNQEKPIIFDE